MQTRPTSSLFSRILLLAALPALVLGACTPEPEPLPEAFIAHTSAEYYGLLFDSIWQTLETEYVYQEIDGLDWEELHSDYRTQAENAASLEELEALMAEMFALLPADTIVWHNRQERIDGEINPPQVDEESIEGIGIFVSFYPEPEPHLVILEVIPGGPAQRAGLEDHDSITAIDDQPITLEEGIRAIDRITGELGTDVTLTIDTPEGHFGDITITREYVDLLNSRRFLSAFLPGTTILYIRFPRLGYPQLGIDFATGVRAFADQQQISGMILDLRIATTGTGWPLDEVLSLFTDGEVGESYSAASSEPYLIEGAQDLYTQDIPLVLLIGPDTSGLPEIFAASLQGNGRAPAIGLPTAGNIEGFENLLLTDSSYLRLATGSYRDANGTQVGIDGVPPVLTIESTWDQVTNQDDPVVVAAARLIIEYLLNQRTQGMPHETYPQP